MAKARQQYFADETTLQKESREFAITPDIINKLDSIETGAQVNVIETVKVNGTALVPDANKAVNVEVPDVIDNLFSTSTDDALSAKQGKVLYDYLQNIASRGRYLSNWNCVTGLAVTNPSENPYPYKAGDYYSVSNVAAIGGTNYRPNGTQYIIGQASTTVETELVSVSDFYLYDGTNWLLLANSARQIAVDNSLSTTSTNPVENRVVTNAINGKQDTLVAGTNIQIASDGKTISATDTTYSAGTNISIDANNEISATDTTYTAGANIQISNQNVISATDTVYAAGTNVQINNNVISATDTTYTAGTGISIDSNNVISNTQTSAEWGNITGTLSDQTDLQSALDAKQDDMVILSYGNSTWNDFITAYQKNGVVYCRASSNSNPATGTQGRLAFMAYVNNANNPTEVEFQYYRSRSDHNSAANQLDEVYVYKLTSNGTWTVTQRNTAAKATAGTGINLTYGSGNMTISNTGVTSVNGQTGDVTISGATWGNITGNIADQTDLQEAISSATAGAVSDTAYGDSWDGVTGIAPSKNAVYDKISAMDVTISGKQDTLTAGDNITITSNTISAIDTTYAAGTGINIGSITEGPFGVDYHVPSKDEQTALCGILTTTFGLASTDATIRTYLKMPLAGYRDTSSSNIHEQGTDGYYWSSSPNPSNVNYSYGLYFYSSGITPQYDDYRANGFSVRCFKNSPVIPDSSWTTLYDGSSVAIGAGVFYNSTLGLISVSGDGITWYTIKDKNEGATTVYNSGDTLSEANCGKYYQWGNIYGFAWTGSITTSSTQVDASGYGPGNYYDSSTFITYNGAWDSSNNVTLWNTNTINNAISNTGVTSVNGQTGDVTISGATWGNITGTLSDQTDLNNALSAKANSSDVNTKTFTLSSTSDITNASAAVTWYENGNTPIIKMTLRTEPTYFYLSYDMVTSEMGGDRHILYFKSPVRNGKYEQIVITTDTSWSVTNITESEENALSTQIAYTAKGTSTKVPTITTNTLGQVTAITETNIAFPVTSVNGQTGAVTVNDVKSMSTAPSSPTEGMVWYDKTNDQLKVYDGTNWNVTGKEYNAGEGISIGDVSMNARKGPSPDGFHVPSLAEWKGLKTIMDGLSLTTGDGWRINLHMPFAGSRDSSDASLNSQEYAVFYWSSSPFSASSDSARCLYLDSSLVDANGNNSRAIALSVRCFKDSYVTPDSNWTVVQGTLGSAGIFWNQSEGLISITDGTNGYTIMDKNLGATAVYNDGDTLTQANMGNMYQWGNNYGFPSTGDVSKTSSTQVNASAYGPTNPYSSDTFITGNDDWSSVHNDDLWGDTSGTFTQENVISNTGVLSVNGQTGDVTLNAGDMNYSDFNWASKTGATITLDLASTISPSADFTVNAPSTIKDGQTYILRVNNEGTAYEMTLGTNVTNPYDTDITLTDGGVDQFVFLAINGELELQPEGGGGGGGDYQLAPNSPLKPKYRWYGTQAQYDALTQYYTDEEGDTVYFTI